VSERLINSAAVVRDHGAPDLNDAVLKGHIAASTAEQVAQRPLEQQRAILESLPRDAEGKLTPEAKKALAPVIKEVRAAKQLQKKERRDNREAELGQKILAMPEKKYGVAIEDFEWDHEPWSRETGMDRHPGNHYPTAADAHTPEEIVARTAERFKCLADICVLYMWTTIPHEAIAHKMLELRGFKYVTQRVWDKVRNGKGRGPGYWVTGEHEILLIAVRGDVVPPATAHFPSRFEAPVGEHSEKPDQQYEHAEFHFPNIPKIELNARRVRAGWDRWGYEAPLPATESAGEPAIKPTPIRIVADDYEFPSCQKRDADNVPPFGPPTERRT
jgi:N6-adenosine-specific RNA methylase IME4